MKRFKMITLIFTALSSVLGCSTFKKYKPEKYTKNKPVAKIQIDGSKTNFSFMFLGFGSQRNTYLHLRQKKPQCYQYLGTISTHRNQSSPFLDLPAGVKTHIKYQRVVQTQSGRQHNIRRSNSYFVFIPIANHKYRFILDESVVGMTDLQALQTNPSGKTVALKNSYQQSQDSVYEKECD